MAVVNYTGTIDGQPLTSLAPTAKGLTEQKGFWVEIKPGSFIPGFSEQLIGAKAGEQRTVNVDFPADFVSKELQGKKGVYQVEVVEAKEKILPELNDELAKKYGADNVEKLTIYGVRTDRKRVEILALKSCAPASHQHPVGKIKFFELPESAVAGKTRNLVYDLVRQNKQRGDDLSGNISDSYGTTSATTSSNTIVSGPFNNANGQIGISLTQPLLKNFWIDSTRLQITADKNNLKYSEQGLRAQLITSITAIETAYYELIYARENLQVQQEALTLAQTQLDQDRQRMQIGTLAQLSVEQDESQAAQNQANVITAEFTLVSDENTLKNLITDDYPKWHDVHVIPSEALAAEKQFYDLQDSWNKGMTLRPDLLQAQITMEQQGIQLKCDRNQIYPELDLTGSYGYNGAGTEYNDVFAQFRDQSSPFYSYGAEMTIPWRTNPRVTPLNPTKSPKNRIY